MQGQHLEELLPLHVETRPKEKETCCARASHAYRDAIFLAVILYTAFLVFSYFSFTLQLTRGLSARPSCVASAFAERGLCGWCAAGCAWAALALGGACKLAMCTALVQTARECGDVSFALAHLEDAGAYADGSKWRALFVGSLLTDMAFFALCQATAAVAHAPLAWYTYWDWMANFSNVFIPISTSLNFGSVMATQLLVLCAARDRRLAELQHSKGCCGQCCWGLARWAVGVPFKAVLLGLVVWSLVHSASAKACEPV